jgi:HK97 gp10 family phage protein
MTVEYLILRDMTGLAEGALAEAIAAEVAAISEAIRAEAEANAPQEHENRIGKSLAVVPFTSDGWQGLGAEVGTSGHWGWLGHIHEFGTVKMPAHPFLGPAAERHAAKVNADMEKATKAGIEKATGVE